MGGEEQAWLLEICSIGRWGKGSPAVSVGFPLDHGAQGLAQGGRWEGFVCSWEYSLGMTAPSCERNRILKERIKQG